jgi:hypothetical protein
LRDGLRALLLPAGIGGQHDARAMARLLGDVEQRRPARQQARDARVPQRLWGAGADRWTLKVTRAQWHSLPSPGGLAK